MDPLSNRIYQGDALSVLKTFEPKTIDCCITSPPYWKLRDYGTDGQLGREKDHKEYIEKLLAIFDEVKRVLIDKGSCWVVIADTSYLGIPERLMLEMKGRGWIFRGNIIWLKRNSTQLGAKRGFNMDWEHVYWFVKSADYYFETQYDPYVLDNNGKPKYEFRYKSTFGGSNNKSGQGAFNYIKPRKIIPNPKGKIKRSVWDYTIQTFKGAHFAVFPESLIEPMIKSTCPISGICLDPFMGSGTTAVVARKNHRRFVGIELNKSFIRLATKRLKPLMEQQTLEIAPTRGNRMMKCPRCGRDGRVGCLDPKNDKGYRILHHKPLKSCRMLTPEDIEKVRSLYQK